MITILGPTTSGKTSLAANLAAQMSGEVISADSRQVYQGMNIGTGKDLDEFSIEGKNIPYHLINIRDAGYEYNMYEYQTDFHSAHADIIERNKLPILCGGTGMYIESVLKGYKLIHVPVNQDLRDKLELITHEELVEHLAAKVQLHNTTDSSTKSRAIRAYEIAEYYEQNDLHEEKLPKIETQIFGIAWERGLLKKRITARLQERIESGMIEEVQGLMDSGIPLEKMKSYGLEYKFIAQHLSKELAYNDMYQKLNSAIHQFAKRQMTWYRRMEKNGFQIRWIQGELPLNDKVELVISAYTS